MINFLGIPAQESFGSDDRFIHVDWCWSGRCEFLFTNFPAQNSLKHNVKNSVKWVHYY